jgi:hypothetical protein
LPPPTRAGDPGDAADAVEVSERGVLVFAREAGGEQQHRAGELVRGGHLQRDVAAEAVAGDDVDVEVGGEPGGERRSSPC